MTVACRAGISERLLHAEMTRYKGISSQREW